MNPATTVPFAVAVPPDVRADLDAVAAAVAAGKKPDAELARRVRDPVRLQRAAAEVPDPGLPGPARRPARRGRGGAFFAALAPAEAARAAAAPRVAAPPRPG
jgi:hypothetical protein